MLCWLCSAFSGEFTIQTCMLLCLIAPDLRASSVGVMTAFAFIVGALAPLLLGYLKTDYGLSFGISFLAIFYLLGALAVFVAIKFFFLKEFYEGR